MTKRTKKSEKQQENQQQEEEEEEEWRLTQYRAGDNKPRQPVVSLALTAPRGRHS